MSFLFNSAIFRLCSSCSFCSTFLSTYWRLCQATRLTWTASTLFLACWRRWVQQSLCLHLCSNSLCVCSFFFSSFFFLFFYLDPIFPFLIRLFVVLFIRICIFWLLWQICAEKQTALPKLVNAEIDYGDPLGNSSVVPLCDCSDKPPGARDCGVYCLANGTFASVAAGEIGIIGGIIGYQCELPRFLDISSFFLVCFWTLVLFCFVFVFVFLFLTWLPPKTTPATISAWPSTRELWRCWSSCTTSSSAWFCSGWRTDSVEKLRRRKREYTKRISWLKIIL